jgi:hypothetical protein
MDSDRTPPVKRMESCIRSSVFSNVGVAGNSSNLRLNIVPWEGVA